MRSRPDVAVVGGGPAGSRAAELLAAAGASVTLLDPRVPWEKPCGGGLTAAALRNTPELEELGAAMTRVHELVVVAPSGAKVSVPLSTPWSVVSRTALSAWGLERARAAGAIFRPTGARRVRREAHGWTVETDDGGVFRAQYLVAADGAASRLRPMLAPRLHPRLDAARVAYPQAGVERGRAVFWFLPGARAYAWDFPRPLHHSVGAVAPPKTRDRAALDRAIHAYRQQSAGPEPLTPAGAAIGTSLWRSGGFDDMAGREWVLLGDAAGLADPATGEGIDYALRSASLAARAFTSGGFTAYPALARAAFGSEVRRARWVIRLIYRPRVIDVLVRGAGRSRKVSALLRALADAVNEHRSLMAAIARTQPKAKETAWRSS